MKSTQCSYYSLKTSTAAEWLANQEMFLVCSMELWTVYNQSPEVKSHQIIAFEEMWQSQTTNFKRSAFPWMTKYLISIHVWLDFPIFNIHSETKEYYLKINESQKYWAFWHYLVFLIRVFSNQINFNRKLHIVL